MVWKRETRWPSREGATSTGFDVKPCVRAGYGIEHSMSAPARAMGLAASGRAPR